MLRLFFLVLLLRFALPLAFYFSPLAFFFSFLARLFLLIFVEHVACRKLHGANEMAPTYLVLPLSYVGQPRRGAGWRQQYKFDISVIQVGTYSFLGVLVLCGFSVYGCTVGVSCVVFMTLSSFFSVGRCEQKGSTTS